MKPMGTDDQVFEYRYYKWSGNRARRKMRREVKKAKRIVRRAGKQKLRRQNEFYI